MVSDSIGTTFIRGKLGGVGIEQEKRMNDRYFVVCQDEDGAMVFATHGYLTTRKAAESYARTLAPGRNPLVVVATSEFYQRDSVQACGS